LARAFPESYDRRRGCADGPGHFPFRHPTRSFLMKRPCSGFNKLHNTRQSRRGQQKWRRTNQRPNQWRKARNELDLHGNIQGTNVAFNSPESKLSSLYFLSLTGQASLILKTVTFSLKGHHNEENETSFLGKNHHGEEGNETTTVTLTVNITKIVTVTTPVANTAITTTVSNSTAGP
jgi:hypothetical protein